MKILLLDDHKIFGQSIKHLLEEQQQIKKCDYLSSVDEFYNSLSKESYDLLLIDINLKDERTGFDIVKETLDKYPGQKIVILTSYDQVNYKEKAFKAGVKDFINKSVEIEELLRRIDKVTKGSSENKPILITDPLTKREIEVLKELVKGSNKKDIAKKLFISERTLYNHISSIYDKLRAKNAIEAYNRAMEMGYVDPVM